MNENRLTARVLIQAVIDLSDKGKETRGEALNFLLNKTGALKEICDILGLNYRRIVSVVQKAPPGWAKKLRLLIPPTLKMREEENDSERLQFRPPVEFCF